MSETNPEQNPRGDLAMFAKKNNPTSSWPFFEKALEADRGVHVVCPACGKRLEVAVPDWRARQQAVAELLNQGYGRPGTEQEGAGEFTLVRILDDTGVTETRNVMDLLDTPHDDEDQPDAA